ncbi:MAG: molybdopterin-dependent oxidoreductase [Coriobacteriales bacterium]
MTSTSAWLKEAKADTPAEPEERASYTYHNEHCLCNCMLKCTVRNGRLVMVEPRPNEDKRFQNICLKGISEIQHIYGKARIQSPMRRVGERGSGEFEVISWDEAFETIAREFKAMVVLDPRFSATASKADIWVNLRAGTDPAYFLGMAKYILDEKLYKREHLLENTSFPFLVNPKTGEVLGKVTTVRAEDGTESQVKVPYVWDTRSGKPAPHDYTGSHPLAWIEELRCAVDAACPNGYYSRLLTLANDASDFT